MTEGHAVLDVPTGVEPTAASALGAVGQLVAAGAVMRKKLPRNP
jgi:hypothetical protein